MISVNFTYFYLLFGNLSSSLSLHVLLFLGLQLSAETIPPPGSLPGFIPLDYMFP